jgi:tripartite-type tricarboxylate transporter receptor subunit TctC
MVVAYPAGGSTDIVGRLVAEQLSRMWGQQVIIDNKGGAAGTIGANQVAKSEPDGYTLLMAASPEIAIARSTQRDLPYDPVKDFTPIALVAMSPFLLVVHPSVSATTVRELIEIAKARPKALNYASFGAGTSNHFVAELFRVSAGVDIVHVPYRGSAPAMTDLLGGRIQMMFDTFPAALQYVQSGQLRAIGAATTRRSLLAPEVATLDEAGLPGFVGGSWVGLLAPAGTPEPIVSKIRTAMERLMREGFGDTLQKRGLEEAGASGAEFQAFIEREVAKWANVAQQAGIARE